MSGLVDTQSYGTAVLAFRDAWSSYNQNDQNSCAALIAAAAGLGSSITTLLNDNPGVVTAATRLGVFSSLASYFGDMKSYNDALSLGDSRGVTSASLAIASDVAGAGAGLAAILAAANAPDLPVAGGLGFSSALLTTISLGAQAAKTIYDAGNKVSDFIAELDDDIRKNWVEDYYLYHGLGGLSDALTNCCVSAAQAAEAGDSVRLSTQNGTFVATATSETNGVVNSVQTTVVDATGQTIRTSATASPDGSIRVALSSGALMQLSGLELSSTGAPTASSAGFYFQDSAGNRFYLDPLQAANGTFTLTQSNTNTIFSIGEGVTGIVFSGAGITFAMANGAFASCTLGSTAQCVLTDVNGDTYSFSGSQISIDDNLVGGTTSGAAGTVNLGKSINADGTLGGDRPLFVGSSNISGNIAATQASTNDLLNTVNSSVGLDTPTGSVSNSLLSVNLTDLTQIGQSGLGSGGDGTPLAGNNVIFSFGGVLISALGQASNDLADVSSSEIANGLYRPYYESLQSAFNDVPAATDLFNSTAGSTPFPTTAQDPIPYWDLVAQAVQTNPTPTNTDPLLIDLTGAGIGVSNWIQNPVYFDTNVVPDANGNATTTPDGMEHQTAWMQPGTAMRSPNINTPLARCMHHPDFFDRWLQMSFV